MSNDLIADYAAQHRDKTNLLIHIITVPLFILLMVGAALALLRFQVLSALVNIGLAYACFGLQGYGHNNERNRPAPFKDPQDFILRSLREQFITFPKFVFTGGFYQNWTRAN